MHLTNGCVLQMMCIPFVAGWWSRLLCTSLMLTQELLLFAGVSQLPAAHCAGVKLEQHWAQRMPKQPGSIGI
jgi:hypothetical protein